jgi:diguanylate cyclase (GGDEF)-like protein
MNLQTVYALVYKAIRTDSEDFLLIAKMRFDPKPFLDQYHQLKGLLYFFIVFILTSTMLSFMLIYRAVIKKIIDITRQIQKDEPIVVRGHLFNEFKYFIQRYNSVLLRWKEELRRLNEISMQDELTKCYNRRYFNRKMNQQIELYQRYGHTFSMLMFDIDDFKRVNDVYGHSVGDYVLRAIAGDVKKQIRTIDFLCRIGGEEFAVILPETGLESAAIVAEKVRAAIEKEDYIDGERVTVSVGVGSICEEDDFNTFYRAVDSLLYASKENGKNRVHLRA